MRPRTLALAALALLVALAALPVGSVPAEARPPPEAVCGVCGETFEEAGDDVGVPLTVESSALRVRVGDDGVGAWTARVELDDESAATFRERPDRLDRVVRRTFEEHRVFTDDRRRLETRMDGDTAVVTFEVPGMAYRGYGDVLVVDYFHDDEVSGTVYVDADRFVVTGPEESALLTAPPGTRTNETAAVWSADDGDPSSVGSQTYLTFGPDAGLATTAAAYASLAADSGPGVLTNVAWVAFVPTLVLTIGVLLIRHFDRRFDGDRGARRFGPVVAGLGVLWGLCLLVVRAFSGSVAAMAWLLALQLVALGVVSAVRPKALGFRRLVAATVGPQVALAVATAVAMPGPNPWFSLSALALEAAVVLFLPLGYAARRGGSTRPLSLAIVAAPVTFALPLVPFGGYGVLFVGILLVVWVLVTLATGSLVYRLGWALGGESARGHADDSTRATA
ncbi:hypothetical protein [Haloferax prahovense]|uniref:hypothetical protein n=1 Tax=Haloferax prahovense TaxID=381852 RepID=UPI000679E96F|nr:hypothetical protein [Haloferax prahovense]